MCVYIHTSLFANIGISNAVRRGCRQALERRDKSIELGEELLVSDAFFSFAEQ